MKIGIVGSRRRIAKEDYRALKKRFDSIYVPGDEIVSGGCYAGADSWAEFIAKRFQIPIHIYYAAWDRLGKSAGFQRNGLIAQKADVLIAVVASDRKGGTEDTIKKYRLYHAAPEVYLV